MPGHDERKTAARVACAMIRLIRRMLLDGHGSQALLWDAGGSDARTAPWRLAGWPGGSELRVLHLGKGLGPPVHRPRSESGRGAGRVRRPRYSYNTEGSGLWSTYLSGQYRGPAGTMEGGATESALTLMPPPWAPELSADQTDVTPRTRGRPDYTRKPRRTGKSRRGRRVVNGPR